MEEKHINPVELARRWRLSPRTLERWRWQGKGPAYLKIGVRIVYRKDDIESFEADQRIVVGDAKTLSPSLLANTASRPAYSAKK
jgi:hypothetical protein